MLSLTAKICLHSPLPVNVYVKQVFFFFKYESKKETFLILNILFIDTINVLEILVFALLKAKLDINAFFFKKHLHF